MAKPSGRLTIKDVRAWLRTLDSWGVCGYSYSFRDCPLATYLSATHAGHEAYVEKRFCWVRDSLGRVRYQDMPTWAQDFMGVIDGGLPMRPVAVQEALAYLEDAERAARSKA